MSIYMNHHDIEEIRDIAMQDLAEFVPKDFYGSLPYGDIERWQLDLKLAKTLDSSTDFKITPRQRRASYVLSIAANCGVMWLTFQNSENESDRTTAIDILLALVQLLPGAARRYAKYLPEKQAINLLELAEDDDEGEDEGIPVALLDQSSDQGSGSLPWGNHETFLLRKLAQASDRFWKLHDPTDPTTAPTNQQVIDWLKEEGVSDRTAEVMATILRADGLPPGPRK